MTFRAAAAMVMAECQPRADGQWHSPSGFIHSLKESQFGGGGLLRFLAGYAVARAFGTFLRLHLPTGFRERRGYDRFGRRRCRQAVIPSTIRVTVSLSAVACWSSRTSIFLATVARLFLKLAAIANWYRQLNRPCGYQACADGVR